MPYNRIFAIVNPAAGRDEPVASMMNRAFQAENIDWDMRLTHAAGDGERLAKAAIADGYELIVIYGGDGTVMDVANGVYGSDVPVAILPGGTANGVAGSLDMTDGLETALEKIAAGDGSLIACDLGQINDRRFLLRVDVGNVAEQIEQRERDEKNLFGIWAYLFAIFKSRLSDETHTFRMTIDNQEEIERSGAAFMIMNMSHIGAYRFKFTEDIRPDDGQMDIFVVKDEMRALAHLALSAIKGVRFQDLFEHLRGQRIHVETDTPLAVLADGEPIGETPFTVETVPQAINLFAPNIEQID